MSEDKKAVQKQKNLSIKELTTGLAKKTNSTQKSAREFLGALPEITVETLKSEKRLTIRGLGIFFVRNRAARKGTNPKTGESMSIKAKKVIAFRPAKKATEAL